jgi:predicted dinucleotide-binding enzyme
MAPLRTALFGVGAWGKVLARAASQSQKIRFAACVGRNPERLAAFSGDTGIPARDAGSVLADGAIDAVVLALPNEMHLDFARRAAAAGKHIYIEKPIANTMADALAIAALEKTHGVRIVVGHCARLLTGFRAIRAATTTPTSPRKDDATIKPILVSRFMSLSSFQGSLPPATWRCGPAGCLGLPVRKGVPASGSAPGKCRDGEKPA